jgi:hypothetical protein
VTLPSYLHSTQFFNIGLVCFCANSDPSLIGFRQVLYTILHRISMQEREKRAQFFSVNWVPFSNDYQCMHSRRLDGFWSLPQDEEASNHDYTGQDHNDSKLMLSGIGSDEYVAISPHWSGTFALLFGAQLQIVSLEAS